MRKRGSLRSLAEDTALCSSADAQWPAPPPKSAAPFRVPPPTQMTHRSPQTEEFSLLLVIFCSSWPRHTGISVRCATPQAQRSRGRAAGAARIAAARCMGGTTACVRAVPRREWDRQRKHTAALPAGTSRLPRRVRPQGASRARRCSAARGLGRAHGCAARAHLAFRRCAQSGTRAQPRRSRRACAPARWPLSARSAVP